MFARLALLAVLGLFGPEPDAADERQPADSDAATADEQPPAAPPTEMRGRVGVNAVGDVFGENAYATEIKLVDGKPVVVRKQRPDVGGSLLGVVAPIPDWNGNFGPGLGVTMKLLYRPLGREDRSPPSSTTPFALGWLKFSWVVGIDQRLYLRNDRWRVHVLAHIGSYSLRYKYLGTNQVDIDYVERSSLIESMVWRRLYRQLYLGAGWDFRWANYVAEGAAEEILRTANFGRRYSISSGPSAQLMFDNRDDQFAATRGHHISLGGAWFPTATGATSNHARVRASYAGYVAATPKLVVAGRLQWQSAFGDVPLAALPRYGGSGDVRGYQPGRFVGRHRGTGQFEVRWTIKEPWGLVFFAELGTIFEAPEDWRPDDPWKLLLPGTGVGVRYRPSPLSRLNLRGDVVVSRYGPVGLSFGLGEAF